MTTAQQAYDGIKALESQGKIPFPGPSVSKFVGTFDAAKATFHFAVPTVTETVIEIVEVNGKPQRITEKHTVGKVKVDLAIDLLLKFIVQNPQGPLTVQVGSITATAAPGQNSVTVDVGPLASIPLPGGKLSDIYATMWSGSATAEVLIRIIRPPLVTGGAFTIPAVPIALIYAPPPGAQSKNFAEYSNAQSITTKIAGIVSSSTSTKTTEAYGGNDFITKLSGIASNIAALATDPDSKAAAQGVVLGLNLISSFIPVDPDSQSNALTTTTEHDLQTTDTDTTTAGTPAGLGPGVGDRFVYLLNVRVAWVIAGGDLSFTVLGDDGIRAFAAQQLQSDLAAISSTPAILTGPTTGLDGKTLGNLLSLDPFVGNPSPLLTAPRFVKNDPPTAGGSGTDPTGDVFTVVHEITTTDTTTRSNVSTTITDYKPGWLLGLFGDNDATEDQMSFTYTSSQSLSVDDKQTATVHFFAAPTDPPYLVGLYFDRLFGTFAFTPVTAQATTKALPLQAGESAAAAAE